MKKSAYGRRDVEAIRRKTRIMEILGALKGNESDNSKRSCGDCEEVDRRISKLSIRKKDEVTSRGKIMALW